jgi:hypothetical protein
MALRTTSHAEAPLGLCLRKEEDGLIIIEKTDVLGDNVCFRVIASTSENYPPMKRFIKKKTTRFEVVPAVKLQVENLSELDFDLQEFFFTANLQRMYKLSINGQKTLIMGGPQTYPLEDEDWVYALYEVKGNSTIDSFDDLIEQSERPEELDEEK